MFAEESRFPIRRRWASFLAAALFLLTLSVLISHPRMRQISHLDNVVTLLSSKDTSHQSNGQQNVLKKPAGLKVHGLVFAGRPASAAILDCFLRKNLASNGGWLDGVRWVINAHDADNVHDASRQSWLENLVDDVPEYTSVIEYPESVQFNRVWRENVVPGAITVKFDDDMVWIGENVIPEIVTSLLEEPKAATVLVNLINSAALGWIHESIGAMHAYLPERKAPEHAPPESYGPKAWRASALPTHRLHEDLKSVDATPFFDTDEDWDGGAPYPNHRWLPVRNQGRSVRFTPVRRANFDPFSFQLGHWQIAAQAHYSFLQNLETDSLSKYMHFGNNVTGLWDLLGMRGNANLMAVRSDDILNNVDKFDGFDGKDDEAFMTQELPGYLGRECYIQSRALAVHFSFGPQRTLYETDLLARYRAYANEFVCASDRQVEPIEVWPGIRDVWEKGDD